MRSSVQTINSPFEYARSIRTPQTSSKYAIPPASVNKSKYAFGNLIYISHLIGGMTNIAQAQDMKNYLYKTADRFNLKDIAGQQLNLDYQPLHANNRPKTASKHSFNPEEKPPEKSYRFNETIPKRIIIKQNGPDKEPAVSAENDIKGLPAAPAPTTLKSNLIKEIEYLSFVIIRFI